MAYVPAHFRETDPARIAALARDYSFGALVTVDGGVPFASHLPLIADMDRGEKGTVTGHMARANPQWRHFAVASEVLAIFEGPHTYVSPSWYAHAGVPTWNYAVVHLYGRPRVIDDKAAVGAIVERLSAIHEARFTDPWRADLAEARTSRMLEHIVGFEIEVTRIDAKFKMNQNRPLEDRKRVAAQLRESDSQLDRAVSDIMYEDLERRTPRT